MGPGRPPLNNTITTVAAAITPTVSMFRRLKITILPLARCRQPKVGYVLVQPGHVIVALVDLE